MQYWNPCSGECACCGEQVGIDDSKTIRQQLQDREKNCFWCGDDFDIPEEDIDDIIGDNYDYVEHGQLINDFDCEEQPIGKLSDQEIKNIIKSKYGVDVDKEPFIPPFINKKTGDIYDRAYNATPYEKIVKEYAAHYTLIAVKNNPNTTLNALEKKRLVPYMAHGSTYHRNAYSVKRYIRLEDKPISRLVASGLIDVVSYHHGWIKNPNNVSGQIFEKGVPMFRRNYTISKKGMDVLKCLEKKDRKVVIL